MQKLDKYNYITIELYRHYNPHGGMEASTSLYYLVQKRKLTDALEVLSKLGYSDEDGLVTLAAVQTLQSAGGATW